MQSLPEHLCYRIDEYGTWQDKTKPHPNGHWGLWLTCPGGQIIDYSDPRTWNAPAVAEQRAVLEALGPTLYQLQRDHALQINPGGLRCTPDGYNAAWTEVKRIFEGHIIDRLGLNNKLLKDGKLKDETLVLKLDRWYGLISDYYFASNWPYQQGRSDIRGRLIQNPDAFACVRCVEKEILCHGHREREGQKCDPCHAARGGL